MGCNYRRSNALKINKVANYDLSFVHLHDADSATCCKVRLLAVSPARSPYRLPTPPSKRRVSECYPKSMQPECEADPSSQCLLIHFQFPIRHHGVVINWANEQLLIYVWDWRLSQGCTWKFQSSQTWRLVGWYSHRRFALSCFLALQIICSSLGL